MYVQNSFDNVSIRFDTIAVTDRASFLDHTIVFETENRLALMILGASVDHKRPINVTTVVDNNGEPLTRIFVCSVDHVTPRVLASASAQSGAFRCQLHIQAEIDAAEVEQKVLNGLGQARVLEIIVSLENQLRTHYSTEDVSKYADQVAGAAKAMFEIEVMMAEKHTAIAETLITMCRLQDEFEQSITEQSLKDPNVVFELLTAFKDNPLALKLIEGVKKRYAENSQNN